MRIFFFKKSLENYLAREKTFPSPQTRRQVFAYESFIHSFIPAISIAPLQVLYYSEALPTTARILYISEFHAEAHRQLQVTDLPKVAPWWLERESNPRPSG